MEDSRRSRVFLGKSASLMTMAGFDALTVGRQGEGERREQGESEVGLNTSLLRA